jgi:hypothetical protein
LNDIENRAFIEEERRRQEAARQRLAHASTIATAVLGANNNQNNAQRRPLIRQTAMRIARGGLRSDSLRLIMFKYCH